jgi:acyl-CoA dehydrogenase family protein 9
MWQSLKDMAKRSESRKQFGAPIREFQLIQEKMVRAKAHAFAARNMTFFTAGLLEEDPLMNVAIESSHCKLYGTTRCWNTLYDALQVAGGAGYITTLPYEKRMRDFRVTTIFEGTTEIHSIYPPLTLFRSEGKRVSQAKSPFARLRLLWKISRPAGLGRETLGEPLLDRAVRTAGRSEAIFKRLLARGMRKYGKKVVQEEFFLRRMTETSLSLFQLIASISVLWERYGREIPDEERALLEYLIEETRLIQSHASGKLERPLEQVHRQVMESIAEA